MGIPNVSPPDVPGLSVSLGWHLHCEASELRAAGTSAFFTGSGSGATAGTAGTEGMPRWKQI